MWGFPFKCTSRSVRVQSENYKFGYLPICLISLKIVEKLISNVWTVLSNLMKCISSFSCSSKGIKLSAFLPIGLSLRFVSILKSISKFIGRISPSCLISGMYIWKFSLYRLNNPPAFLWTPLALTKACRQVLVQVCMSWVLWVTYKLLHQTTLSNTCRT